MGVNLKELAAELKLSPSTVSRALNDSYEISEATKQKVVLLAKKLDYQPNPFARSLRENKSKTIAVVIPERINSYFAKVVDGIEEIAQAHGYHLLVYCTQEDVEREKKIVNLLMNGRADAIVISVSCQLSDNSHLNLLHERGFPLVFFDRICAEIPTTKYTTNNYESAFEGTRHLIQQGCKKIAFFMLSKELSITKERYRGYKEAIEQAGLNLDSKLNLTFSQDEDQNILSIKELLLSENRPDGILSSIGKLALATYHAVKQTDLSIPRDLKIISFFADPTIASLLNPSLTTITTPTYKIGEECGKLLIQKLTKPRQPDLPNQIIVMPSKITIRSSTIEI